MSVTAILAGKAAFRALHHFLFSGVIRRVGGPNTFYYQKNEYSMSLLCHYSTAYVRMQEGAARTALLSLPHIWDTLNPQWRLPSENPRALFTMVEYRAIAFDWSSFSSTISIMKACRTGMLQAFTAPRNMLKTNRCLITSIRDPVRDRRVTAHLNR